MDLRTSYPRSVKEKIDGVVMIARTIDKGKAFAAGTNGEYNYDCPMDKGVFSFLGIDGNDLLAQIKNAKTDAEVETYLRSLIATKSPQEIEEFNREFLSHAPEPGSDGEKYFLDLRNQVAPERTDVTTWADLLDLDEKRDVPLRVPAPV